MSLSAKSFSLLQRDVFLFITNLITGVIVARKLGPEAMGLWIILQLIPSYAEAFGRMKFDIAAVFFLGKGKYGIGDMTFALNMLAIFTSVAIVIPIVWQFDWFYKILFGKTDAHVESLMYLILLQIPLHFLLMNYTYLYIYREDVKTYNTMVVIRGLFSSVVSISLLVIFELGLFAVVIASILSLFISLLYGVLKFGPIERRKHLLNGPLIKDLFAYGFKLYLTGIVGHLNTYITRLIIVFYLLPSQVAFFGMAQNQGQLIDKIPSALNTLLFPRVSKAVNNDDSARLVAKAFRVVLLILIIVGLFGFILIKPVVFLLYGRSYLPIVIPFWIILPGLLSSGAATVLNQYFTGIGRADICLKIALVPLFIQVIMALILIPPMGLVGAALSFLCALLSITLIQVIVFIKISSCNAKNNLLFRKEDFQIVNNFIRLQIAKILSKLFVRRRVIKHEIY